MVKGFKGMMRGNVAIVTGAGGGIGKKIALRLAENGVNVAICDLDSKRVESVAEEIRAIGQIVLAIGVDVSKPIEVSKFIEKVIGKFKHIDILVNNVGKDLLLPTSEVTLEQWDEIVNVNLRSHFLFCQAVAKEMIKEKRGKIINMASVGAHGGIPGMAAYCASKAGVLGLTRSLSAEWAKYNVKVNSISPGLTETPMVKSLRDKSPDVFEEREKRIPLGRPAQVEDIVNLVMFLVSPQCDYITGQDIIIDGGLFAVHPGFV